MTSQILKTDKAFIVYEKKTGKILHIHHVISMPGTATFKASEMEEEARNLARSFSTTSKGEMKVLKVDPDLLEKTTYSRVDIKKLSLVPVKKKKERLDR
ncbi:MAG TPA: hypothetical protein VLH08_20950 [Acidobacteriota bacterium]|nr:hypothetical protein [Acidobacteriota bacterium]